MDDIGWDFAIGDGKATGSQLAAWPNKPGILSDTAQCIADVRHPDPMTARVMAEKMRRAAQEAAARAGCVAVVVKTIGSAGCSNLPACRKSIRLWRCA